MFGFPVGVFQKYVWEKNQFGAMFGSPSKSMFESKIFGNGVLEKQDWRYLSNSVYKLKFNPNFRLKILIQTCNISLGLGLLMWLCGTVYTCKYLLHNERIFT